jgi:hypothetical protein
MILLIDYGTATAKALLLKDDGAPSFFEVSLGFPAYTKTTVFESLLFVLENLQSLSGQKFVEGTHPLCPLYVMGELASVRLKELLAAEVEDPIRVLVALGVPVVSVGTSLTVVGESSFRGEVSSESVSYWLPFKTMKTEIDNYLANRRLFPTVIPATPRDLEIEQAIAQEKLKKGLGVNGWREGEVYATGAVLSLAPHPALAFLTLLNGLSPQQPLRVILDKRGVLPLLALLKKVDEEKFKALWEKEKPFLSLLGTALWTGAAVSLQIELEGMAEVQEIALTPESLVVFPLRPGEKARVTLEGWPELFLEGGEVGLVFDSRVRPLRLPDFGRERRDQLRRWDKALNVHGEVGELWKD